MTGIFISWTALRIYGGCLGEGGTVAGTVYREVWNKDGQAVLDSDSGRRVLLTGIGDTVGIGKRVAVTGSLYQPESARNPGGYSQRDYLYGKQVLLVMRVDSVTELSDAPLNLRALGSKIRVHIEDILARYMEPQERNVLLGVMTGDTGGLEDSEKTWVRLSGLSHLMAVSGMHVSYILRPVRWMVKRKNWGIAIRSGLCLIPLALFAMVAGFTPSVIRASVMSACQLVGRIIHRKADFLNSFGLAGCVCLLVYPMAVADTGFVLSFGAAFWGHFLADFLKTRRTDPNRLPVQKRGRIKDAFCYGLAVYIGLLPVMLYKFNMISAVGLLTGIAAAPVSAAMCVLGYGACLVGALPFGAIPAALAGKSLTAVTGFLTALARIGSNIPVFRTVSPPLWTIGLYYGVLCWLLWGRTRIRARCLVAAVTAVSLIFAGLGWWVGEPVKLIWFDVGQGSSALVQAGGANLLIDGGDGLTNVSGLLWKNGISRLDYVILSHGDDDHSQGLWPVIEEHRVNCLIVPDNPEDEDAMALAEAAHKKGSAVSFLSGRADIFLKEDVRVALYCLPVRGSLNNSSAVVQLETAYGSVLFPGDLEQEGERAIAETDFFGPCDCITAAHHGAANGTGDTMLTRTVPYFTVISVGRNNRYGHPREETIRRLETGNIKIFRTDRDGAVIMTYQTDGYIGILTWLTKEKLQYRK